MSFLVAALRLLALLALVGQSAEGAVVTKRRRAATLLGATAKRTALVALSASEPAADLASEPGPSSRDRPRSVVWIAGYGRSATSTVLSMVNAASLTESNSTFSSPILRTIQVEQGDVRNLTDGSTPVLVREEEERATLEATLEATLIKPVAQLVNVYSLFEPCHEGDRLLGELQGRGCSALLSTLARCDFSEVEWLHGFRNPHTTHHGEFTPETATQECGMADLVTIKTIEYAHDLSQALPILDADESIRMLDVVRDPRGIYASWKTLQPFAAMLAGPNSTLMADVCASFAANLKVQHPRLRRVVFEHLVRDPEAMMQGAYNFLELSFGPPQKAWINSTFNADGCEERAEAMGMHHEFTDCHSNSTSSLEKWRQELTEQELTLFSADPKCQEVAWAYGFEP